MLYLVYKGNKKGDNTVIITVIEDLPTVPNPWRRHFARSLDMSIYGLIWMAFSNMVLRWHPDSNLINLLTTYICCGMMLLIEPLLLSTCGTTLGKLVFGLIIRDMDGLKLTYKQASQRTFGVFSGGLGYGIPIYNIVRGIKCYKSCAAQEPMSWEEDFTYKVKDTKTIRAIIYIGLTIPLIAITFLIILQAQMPIHRGNITATQYFENCNDVMSYAKIDYGKYLNEQGQWVDNNFDGTFNIEMNSQPLPEHVLTISDGIVSDVKLEIEMNTNEWVTGYTSQKYIAVISFLAAQQEMNCIRLYRSGILQTISNDLQNYSFIESGVRVTNKVEYSGYDTYSAPYLIPIEGQKQYFHMIFTMEKVTQ